MIKLHLKSWLEKMVGVAGLEPATPGPPDRCATSLRHTPTIVFKNYYKWKFIIVGELT